MMPRKQNGRFQRPKHHDLIISFLLLSRTNISSKTFLRSLWKVLKLCDFFKFRITGVYLLDFFCSSIQFYLLLSPYRCFISFLYHDLYVLGDDALIS